MDVPVGCYACGATARRSAGARVLADRGEIGADDDAVLVATGTGDTEVDDEGVDEAAVETVAVERFRAAIDAHLDAD
jgi:hypothetical protein